jgi:hypothetical protein
MHIIPIEKIKEGMILSDKVTDSFGRTLIGEGVELHSKHIEMIRSYGIKEISIRESDAEPDSDDAPIDPALLEQASKKLEHAFSLVDNDNEVMNEIRRCAIALHARSLKGEQ